MRTIIPTHCGESSRSFSKALGRIIVRVMQKGGDRYHADLLNNALDDVDNRSGCFQMALFDSVRRFYASVSRGRRTMCSISNGETTGGEAGSKDISMRSQGLALRALLRCCWARCSYGLMLGAGREALWA